MKRILSILALCMAPLFAAPASAQAITATLPVTCPPSGVNCVQSTPVVNPDGTAIGANGGLPQNVNIAQIGGVAANPNAVQPISATQLPAAIGQTNMAGSLSVVLASDQSAISVTQSGTVTVQGVGAAGAATTGNPSLFGCTYQTATSLGAVTVGNTQTCQSDGFGNIRVRLAGGNIAAPIFTGTSVVGIAGANTNASTMYPLAALTYGWDGTNTIPAAAALNPSTSAGVTTKSVKGTPGRVYGINAVTGAVAGNVVIYDSASAVTPGASLTSTLILYCMPVAALTGIHDTFQVALSATAGIQMLFSTSCTTYTAVGTPATILSAQFN